MSDRRKLSVLVVPAAAALLLTCAGGPRERTAPAPGTLTDVQRHLVDQLLAREAGWRLAAPPGRDRWFASADFDGDGLRDFAILLRRDRVTRVVAFRGTPAGYSAPNDVARLDWLGGGLLATARGLEAVAPARGRSLVLIARPPALADSAR